MNPVSRRALLASLGVACLPLTGCVNMMLESVQYGDIDKMKAVPPERQFDFDVANDGLGTVVICREYVYAGSGCYIAVRVDGKFVARLDTEEKVVLHLTPGEHLLKVGIDPQGRGLCSLRSGKDIQESGKTLETNVTAGQTKNFRCYVDFGTQSGYEFMRISD